MLKIKHFHDTERSSPQATGSQISKICFSGRQIELALTEDQGTCPPPRIARWLLPQADRCRAVTQAIRRAVVAKGGPPPSLPAGEFALSVFQKDWLRCTIVIAKFPSALDSNHLCVFSLGGVHVFWSSVVTSSV